MEKGISQEEFSLTFEKNWFVKNDVITQEIEGHWMLITTNPSRKWWKFLLQVYSCHLYKADWEYKVKLL